MKLSISLALALLAGLGLAAQEHGVSSAPSFTAEDHPLAWLEGRWVGEGLGGEVEETWLPSAGGAMLGTFRLIAKGRVSFYELMTIENRPDGPVMLLKHFNPDLSSWEEKNEARIWPGELEDGFARFGPVDYERTGEDGLTVRVEVEEGGESSQQELVFRRARPTDPERRGH